VTRSVVVKVGGHALEAADSFESAIDTLARDLAAVSAQGVSPVVVHGAGPQITALMGDLGMRSEFVEGLRVTDERTMQVVAMALGHVNLLLVAGLNHRGVLADGVSGPDGELLRASLRGRRWGRAGGEVKVRPAILEHIAASGAVAVVNPVAVDGKGRLVNCNADTVAGAIAAAIGAEALFMLSDVDQIRLDPDDPKTAVSSITRARVLELVDAGAIREGMRPKMQAALSAVDAGARRVVVTNGARENALADALNRRGLFTEITR
jgi:acetylglutamate kinase